MTYRPHDVCKAIVPEGMTPPCAPNRPGQPRWPGYPEKRDGGRREGDRTLDEAREAEETARHACGFTVGLAEGGRASPATAVPRCKFSPSPCPARGAPARTCAAHGPPEAARRRTAHPSPSPVQPCTARGPPPKSAPQGRGDLLAAGGNPRAGRARAGSPGARPCRDAGPGEPLAGAVQGRAVVDANGVRSVQRQIRPAGRRVKHRRPSRRARRMQLPGRNRPPDAPKTRTLSGGPPPQIACAGRSSLRSVQRGPAHRRSAMRRPATCGNRRADRTRTSPAGRPRVRPKPAGRPISLNPFNHVNQNVKQGLGLRSGAFLRDSSAGRMCSRREPSRDATCE